MRLAVERARGSNMPNANIQRAIDRATGGADGAQLEEIRYEAYGPGGAALLIDSLTDNRNRTVSEVRATLTPRWHEHGRGRCRRLAVSSKRA